MRHRKGNAQLSKPTDQRLAMLKSIVRSLIIYGRVEVTLTRAKAARSLAEKLITIAKKNDLASRRKVESVMGEKKIVTDLFKLAPERFEGRPGGYTRIIKTRQRRGDAAPMALLELV